MSAYYNENDKFNVAWLRELIKEKVIADGEVDERSITEVRAEDLRGFTQCHFFAGIGVWSYALRSAGWPDDEPVWTGSCPCQPFSMAGKRGRSSDERHLWPYWFPLIRESRPVVIFGEQVASDDGLAWLDLVCSDLEGQAYTCGAVDTCAAGFGAPHIRQRLYFVAESDRTGRSRGNPGARPRADFLLERQGSAGILAVSDRVRRQCQPPRAGSDGESPDAREQMLEFGTDGDSGGLANAAHGDRWRGERGAQAGVRANEDRRRLTGNGTVGELGNAKAERLQERILLRGNGAEDLGASSGQGSEQAGAASFWANAAWLPCRDGKLRPVESGTFPLAHGAAARVGRLRGYGNALCAPQAEAFIKAYCFLSRNL